MACGIGFSDSWLKTSLPSWLAKRSRLSGSNPFMAVSSARSTTVASAPTSNGFGMRMALSPIFAHQLLLRSHSLRFFQSGSFR